MSLVRMAVEVFACIGVALALCSLLTFPMGKADEATVVVRHVLWTYAALFLVLATILNLAVVLAEGPGT